MQTINVKRKIYKFTLSKITQTKLYHHFCLPLLISFFGINHVKKVI